MRIALLVLLWQYGGCLNEIQLQICSQFSPKNSWKTQAIYFWLFSNLRKLFFIKLDMYSIYLSQAYPTKTGKALADQKLYLLLNHSSGLIWRTYQNFHWEPKNDCPFFMEFCSSNVISNLCYFIIYYKPSLFIDFTQLQ